MNDDMISQPPAEGEGRYVREVDDRPIVRESTDNRVMRERDFDLFKSEIREMLREGLRAALKPVWRVLAVVVVVLFVPPEDRLHVLQQIPNAVIALSPATGFAHSFVRFLQLL